jgi:hypothetical protein
LIAFDGVVYSNKDHYRLESDYVGSYNLIIDRVNEDDQGEYQCQINTEPRKTKRIFLTVQGKQNKKRRLLITIKNILHRDRLFSI